MGAKNWVLRDTKMATIETRDGREDTGQGLKKTMGTMGTRSWGLCSVPGLWDHSYPNPWPHAVYPGNKPAHVPSESKH